MNKFDKNLEDYYRVRETEVNRLDFHYPLVVQHEKWLIDQDKQNLYVGQQRQVDSLEEWCNIKPFLYW
jgi:hypothetical protein